MTSISPLLKYNQKNVFISRFIGEMSRCGQVNIALLEPACMVWASALNAIIDVAQDYTDNVEG